MDGTVRDYLREKLNPEHLVRAIQAGLDSEDEREKLAAAKIVLTELWEAPKQPEPEKLAPVIEHGVGLNATLAVLFAAGKFTPSLGGPDEERDQAGQALAKPRPVAEVSVGPEPSDEPEPVVESEPAGEGEDWQPVQAIKEAAHRQLFNLHPYVGDEWLVPREADEELLLRLSATYGVEEQRKGMREAAVRLRQELLLRLSGAWGVEEQRKAIEELPRLVGDEQQRKAIREAAFRLQLVPSGEAQLSAPGPKWAQWDPRE